MTGKIFEESNNIYDDQARVLFDYYKKAAEKIVSEEIDLENKITSSEELIKQKTDEEKKAKLLMIISFVVGGICGAMSIISMTMNILSPYIFVILTIAGIGFGVYSLINKLHCTKAIAGAKQQIETFTQLKSEIRRDYKVNKLAVAYVPVATKVPFEGKSFIVDHTGGTASTDFSLSVLHKPDELKQALDELERGIKQVPIVEANDNADKIDTSDYSLSMQDVTMHDYMGNIDRQVRNISYLLDDSDIKNVELPVIEPSGAMDAFLNEYTTEDTGGKPVIKVFDTHDFDSKLQSFSQLSEIKKSLEKNEQEDNTEYFKSLIKTLGESVQITSKLKTNSTTNLLNYTNRILQAVLKSGYNQYSPTLEADEIERVREASFNYEDSVESYHPFQLKQSSRVKYDIFTGNWVAEDNSKTTMPFGMNQIIEEVLMPVINNLMNETRIERLKIYNGINDQKRSYLTKWKQDVEAAFRDNRGAGQELITEITNAFAEYNAAYQTYTSYKETQDAMRHSGSLSTAEVKEKDNSAELIAGFEVQAKQCSDISEKFQAYMDRLQDDINAKAEQFAHVEYYEASLRDTESRDMARSLDVKKLQELDDRRKKLIPVSSYYAAFAEIPPVPKVEDKLMDDFVLNLQEVAQTELKKIAVAENEAQMTSAASTSTHAADTDSGVNDSPNFTDNEMTTPDSTGKPQPDTTDGTDDSDEQQADEYTDDNETNIEA